MKEFYDYLNLSERKLLKHSVEYLISDYEDIIDIESQLAEYNEKPLGEQATKYYNEIQRLAKMRTKFYDEYEDCFEMLCFLFDTTSSDRSMRLINKYIKNQAYEHYAKRPYKRDKITV